MRISIGFAFLACFPGSVAMAHHGAFEYDMTTVLRYEGVILEHRWKNPHSITVLETQSESGAPLTLTIEGSGPSGLRAVGVSASSITVGDRVTAVVNPSKRFAERSAGIEIIKKDGSVVPLRRQPGETRLRQSSETASSIFGTWSPPFDALMGILKSRATWTFTENGRALFDSYNPSMSSQAKCIPVSAPWLMVHPVVHQIEELDYRIVIRTDWMGAERTIYMDGRDHPPVSVRFEQGHSVGQWDNDVLVVDTTNFTDRIYAGVESGEGKHLSERFSVANDGKTMQYSFVLDDPEYLSEPASGNFRWDYRPDLQPSSVECDLEVAQRYLEEYQ